MDALWKSAMNQSVADFFQGELWTLDFKKQQVPCFSTEKELGYWIIHKSGWPYLPLNLPDAPYAKMLEEALAVKRLFVTHRSSEKNYWKSLCIYGEDWHKTDYFKAYPENEGKTADEIHYKWTEISKFCPVTTEYFKTEFPHSPSQRIRFMLLEPGGYIEPHKDREENWLSPINIALNNPKGCVFKMKNKGYVPFQEFGSSCLVDIGNIHSVWNNSDIPRIHIISHGAPKPDFEELVAKSFLKLVN